MSLLDIYETNNKCGNYNLGRMFMDCMVHRKPDGICQIDAFTGLAESNASVLRRAVRLARGLRTRRLLPGDVLALGGRNHLDLHIPYYAALMTGLPILGVDPFFKYDELKHLFKLTKPKIAFCQQETYDLYDRAARDLGMDLKIITFDGGACSFKDFMDSLDVTDSIEDFQPTDFVTDKVYAWLVSTSGTTGMPKVAAFKHQALIDRMLSFIRHPLANIQQEKLGLNMSPVQWVSGFFHAVWPLLNYCTVQTSGPDTDEHLIDVINKYKPVTTMLGPSTLSSILRHEKHCDLTCFKVISITGSKIYKDLIIQLKARLAKDAVLLEMYGQTESIGPVFMPNPMGPIGNCGVPSPEFKVKLIDPDTGKEVSEPNVPGELWTKGPAFTEYYNNPEETENAFSDGWYKTGDLLYRDEKHNYFFVDRIKMIIKYRNYHVMPPELEEVISSHPGVLEVGVTGVPHPEDGQHPVACVVARPSCDVTAEQIKQIVADKLSASKQLRGGVVFVNELPKTSTGKVARNKLLELFLKARQDQADS